MRAWPLLVVVLAACHGGHVAGPPPPPKTLEGDPVGPHAAAIAAVVQPFVDAEVVSGIVVGVYDTGHSEIYGFGVGPGGKPPTGRTLFEIGSITRVFTSLMLADAVQRKEIELEAPVSDLLPPGVTVPTRDQRVITLKELALHSSGLPRLPPSLEATALAGDPYGNYHEDALYADLIRTELDSPPGTVISISNYGAGLLGFAIGRKLGGGYGAALRSRVLDPLGLHDTVIDVPDALASRRAQGTNDDLAPARPWTWDALAGAGALVSDAHDMLQLAVAELDAAQGGERPLVHAMQLSQEAQLEHEGENEGLGWMIDPAGRHWHNGATGGYHSFIGFDVKARRAVVVLVSTQITPIDHLADLLYGILEGKPVKAPLFPKPDAFAPFVGNYDFSGSKIEVQADAKRLYIVGEGVPRHRLVPLSDHEFWVEELQGIAVFERAPDGAVTLVFVVGSQRLTATKLPAAAP